MEAVIKRIRTKKFVANKNTQQSQGHEGSTHTHSHKENRSEQEYTTESRAWEQ